MGELFRVHVLAEREGIPRTSSFATILIERAFDGVTVLLLMAAVFIFAPPGQDLQQLEQIFRVAGGIFAAALVLFFIMSVASERFLSVIRVIARVLPQGRREGAVALVTSFVNGMKVMLHGRSLLYVLGYSVAAWLCESAMYVILAMGFNLRLPPLSPMPPYVFVLNTAVVNLGTMVPSSPGYVGTFEALSMFTLGLFKADPNAALAYTGVLHLALLVPVTLLGFFYLWRHHLSLGSIQRVAPATDASQNSAEATVG
jgi:glycosyltransferase 2 family protein